MVRSASCLRANTRRSSGQAFAEAAWKTKPYSSVINKPTGSPKISRTQQSGRDGEAMVRGSTGEELPACGMFRSSKIAFTRLRSTMASSLDRLRLAGAVRKGQLPYWRMPFSPVFGENAPAKTFRCRLSVKVPTPNHLMAYATRSPSRTI